MSEVTRLWIVLFLVVFAATTATGADTPAQLDVSVEGDQIIVENATPAASLEIIGYEHIVEFGNPVYIRTHKRATVDATGAARVSLGRPTAPMSFWVAVDLSSAVYGIAVSHADTIRRGELPSPKKDEQGKKKRLLAPYDYVYVFAVRPGVGSWELTAADGGPRDADALQNGTIDLDTKDFKVYLKKDRAIDELRAGDLILAFVPHQMALYAHEVKE